MNRGQFVLTFLLFLIAIFSALLGGSYFGGWLHRRLEKRRKIAKEREGGTLPM